MAGGAQSCPIMLERSTHMPGPGGTQLPRHALELITFHFIQLKRTNPNWARNYKATKTQDASLVEGTWTWLLDISALRVARMHLYTLA